MPLLAAGVLADIFGVAPVIGALDVLLILGAVGVRIFAWGRLVVLERDGEAISLTVVDPT